MLPLSRNQNCPPGTPIKGTTIEDVEDVLIQLWSRGVLAPPKLNFVARGGVLGGSTVDNDGSITIGSGVGVNMYGQWCNLPAGCRVKSVTVSAVGNGADDVDINIAKVNRATTTNLIAAAHTWANVPGGAGGTTTIDVDEDDPDSTIGVGETFYIQFENATGPNVTIYCITVEIDFDT